MMIIIMLMLFNKVNTYAIIHLNYDKMTKKLLFKKQCGSHGFFRFTLDTKEEQIRN